ncbi:MAG: SAM-dependent methyltransferase, partial [Bacteroidales bacterium]|nr:SAM-dependent methyltransferase [Bacteroidales bacterium]
TGIPVCIIVLKKCRSNKDVLFINAAELFEKGKKQNVLTEEHINTIVETYQYRKEAPRLSRKVSMEEIAENGYNLNITRYVSLAQQEAPIDLESVHTKLTGINNRLTDAKAKHNAFLKELGVKEI